LPAFDHNQAGRLLGREFLEACELPLASEKSWMPR
jgi:hypothetical protein